VLQIYIRADIPEAGGSLAGAARVQSAQAMELLARAFGHSFWWALAMGAVALVPAVMVPGRRRTRKAAEPAEPTEPTERAAVGAG
jgi:hypothetical protein